MANDNASPEQWQPAGAASRGVSVVVWIVIYLLLAGLLAVAGAWLLWRFFDGGWDRDADYWEQALIGLMLLPAACFMVYAAMRQVGPRVEVKMPPSPLRAGEKYPIHYRFVGVGVGWLSHVWVRARCTETITVDTTTIWDEAHAIANDRPRGRQTESQSRELALLDLVDLQSVERGDLGEGMALLRLPADARRSSTRGSSRKASRQVQWQLEIVGKVPLWADASGGVVFDVMADPALARLARAKAAKFDADRLPRRGSMRR